MTPLALALSLVLGSAASAAPCARDLQIPAALPMVPCPKLVVPSPCHWCPLGDTFLDLHYDTDPRALARSWADALRGAGWTVTAQAGGIVNAAHGKQRVSMRLGGGRTSNTTVIRLTYSPG